MNVADVDLAVEEAGALLRGDGADLRLISADPKTDRIHLAVELAGVECLDCVLEPGLLEEMIVAGIRRRVPGEVEVIVDDPRRLAGGELPVSH
jgi:hypothetical protein